MVLPDAIVEAVVARAPYEAGWDQVRAYLDAGGDVNDVTADGKKTILILFLNTSDMDEARHFQFVRLLTRQRCATSPVSTLDWQMQVCTSSK